MLHLQYLAIVLLAALLAARVFGRIKFPDVTGYLLAGIAIGPMVLNLVPAGAVDDFAVISEVALALIAFSIGAEMKWSNLRKLGTGIVTVTVAQVITTFGAVLLVLLLFGQNLAFSMVIATIACATAPAATLMVVRQYRAKGPVVDTLIPVVALDDALCIIMFGIATAIAQTLLSGSALSFNAMFVAPLLEIVLSLVLGVAAAFVAQLAFRFIRGSGEMTSFMLAVIFALTAVALRFHLSSLLVMMSFGFALSNIGRSDERATFSLDALSAPIFICFFTISGADLDFRVFGAVGLVAVAYILSRVVGKLVGANLGARMAQMEPTVRRYLGFTLIPQAGVAIGLSLVAMRVLPEPFASQTRAIILAATVVYELLGPLITKVALTRAGEIELKQLRGADKAAAQSAQD